MVPDEGSAVNPQGLYGALLSVKMCLKIKGDLAIFHNFTSLFISLSIVVKIYLKKNMIINFSITSFLFF